MSPLVLSSTSAATDAAWLAAADVSAIAHELGAEYRLIGGIPISLLVHHHGVGPGVPDRDTADADMGVPFEVLSDDRLPGALLAHGYAPVESNRFRRRPGGRTLVIDVLGPSWEGRLVTNQRHGSLYVDEVPGLLEALRLEPTLIEVQATLTTGQTTTFSVALPDVRAALILKAYAYRGRFAPRDALDVWRLLEAARQAGLGCDDWPTGSGTRDAAHVLHQFFAAPGGRGATSASPDPAVQARVRALALAVVPAPLT